MDLVQANQRCLCYITSAVRVSQMELVHLAHSLLSIVIPTAAIASANAELRHVMEVAGKWVTTVPF